jgi:hypothetical protein
VCCDGLFASFRKILLCDHVGKTERQVFQNKMLGEYLDKEEVNDENS